jgi:hypothetical protein
MGSEVNRRIGMYRIGSERSSVRETELEVKLKFGNPNEYP